MGNFALKTNTFGNLLKFILVLGLICNFASTVSAQNYYPTNVGNEWVLESTDSEQRRIYTLENPEDVADQDLTLLKIVTQEIDTGNVGSTDEYFLTTDDEGIKLHKTDIQFLYNTSLIDVMANFISPVIFFPKILNLDDTWVIEADTVILGIPLKATFNLKIVSFENVDAPVATFKNCAKIELTLSTSFPLELESTSYQWLAPEIGPVQYETSSGNIFKIVSFKRSLAPIAQNPPVWNLAQNTFRETGSRLGGILNAKILENVEDYVSEVDNLEISSVSGLIVPPGDGTGFSKNSRGKHDLWVAGRFGNAPITGSITLFAENTKGRMPITINVTINVR